MPDARPVLLKGGCILSFDDATGDFDRGDILIEAGRIADIAPCIEHLGKTGGGWG